jgi:hypothetical protein
MPLLARDAMLHPDVQLPTATEASCAVPPVIDAVVLIRGN